jgi:hypothetical protein
MSRYFSTIQAIVSNGKSRLMSDILWKTSEPGEIVAKREYKQDCQPEQSCYGKNPDETGTVPDVHEVEDDNRSLCCGNSHRDVEVQPSKIVKRHINRDEGKAKQRGEDQQIDFLRNNMMCHRSLQARLIRYRSGNKKTQTMSTKCQYRPTFSTGE